MRRANFRRSSIRRLTRRKSPRAGAPLYRTLDDLFNAARPDGVILATPNAVHVDNALDCIRAGVAALVKKPLAHTVEAGQRLCEAVRRAGAKILVGHHRRYNPILARARQIVQQGTLGRIVAVQGSAMFYKPDGYFDEAPWRRQAGGGPILINLIHEIDSLRALCGEIASVQAFVSSATRGFAVEDTAAINLRFANGALGTFLLSDTTASAKSWEQTSRENPGYATCPDEDCYVIAGADGSLGVPTMRLKTYARREDRSWWKPFQASVVEVEHAGPLQRQLDHFCAVIRGEAEPLVTAQDGLQNLRITEAIVEAARNGSTVITA
jgi:predicted dehydrogenase